MDTVNTSKVCSRCGIEKPLSGFPAKGRICRACTAAASRAYYRENLEYCRQRSAVKRQASPRSHPEGKQALNERSRRYREANKTKISARSKLRAALVSGRIRKPARCSVESCRFETADLHAHHPDYSKPLEVVWLCESCHGRTHAQIDTTGFIPRITKWNRGSHA